MAAAQAQAYTVLDAMIACGVNNVILFNGASQTNRIATEVFDGDHTSAMDKRSLNYRMILRCIRN